MKWKIRIFSRIQLVISVMAVLCAILFPVSPAAAQSMGSEQRQVAPFHKISFEGNGYLHVTQGDPALLRLEGDKMLLTHYETYVENGTLYIRLNTWKKKWKRKKINVYVTTPHITELKGSGSSGIVGESTITSPNLDLRLSGSGYIEMSVAVGKLTSSISGSGKIRLKGKSEYHRCKISGSGDLNAFDMPTGIFETKISGSGKGEVNVTGEMRIKISGSGKILYKGRPDISELDISGSGKIVKVGQ